MRVGGAAAVVGIPQAPLETATRLVAYDIETFKISRTSPYPYPVCISIQEEGKEAELYHCQFDQRTFLKRMVDLLQDPSVTLIAQNGSYDMCCLTLAFPDPLIPAFRNNLDALRSFDTMIAQRMLNIFHEGSPESNEANLAALSLLHLGEDMSADKGADSVRTRYGEMWDIPVSQWPAEFVRYSKEDSVKTLRIAQAMFSRKDIEKLQRAIRHRTRAMFGQAHKTANGIKVDKERAAALYEKALKGYDFNEYPNLLQSGIVALAQEAQPHKGGHQKHTEECTGKPCDCPVKLSKPTAPKTSPGKVKDLMVDFSKRYGIELILADKGQEIVSKALSDDCTNQNPQFSTDSNYKSWNFRDTPPPGLKSKHVSTGREEVDLCNALLPEKSNLLSDWTTLKGFDKLANTYMPRFLWDAGNDCQGAFSKKWEIGKSVSNTSKPFDWDAENVRYEWVDRMHFTTNAVVSSARFSSRQTRLYPSLNGQNLPRDLGVRECLTADTGWLIAASDFSALELCSSAWRTMQIYGESRLLDLLQMGRCPHSFYAAQLVKYLDPESDCAQTMTASSYSWEDCLERHDDFEAFKKIDPAYCKEWRTIAKPTGLGRPGGIGAARIQDLAWKQYGKVVTLNQCKQALEVWAKCFPNNAHFLKDGIQKYKSEDGFYCYETPLGMVVDRKTYCATANGLFLQSPSAEGMAEAIYQTAMACLDWTLQDPLFGCKPCDDVHDELNVGIPRDAYVNVRVHRLQEIMETAMSSILEDVPIKTEAALMVHVSKNAFLAKDEEGNYIPYEEKL